MAASFLLSLREGLEAALIIGIVLSALHKMNRPQLRPAVWRGAGSAIVLSILAAFILVRLGAEFEGRAEQIFEGIAMLVAAALLTWMIFWMQRQASGLKSKLESDVHLAAFRGGERALFMLAFLAIGREGFELALFLTASTFASSAIQTLVGAAAGLAVAVFLGYLLFATSRRLSLKRFFQVSNVLLILFAAGLAAHGVHEFNEAGLIPPIVEHIWDVNYLVNEKAPLGQFLSALFGYNGNPSLTETITYVSYFALVWFFSRLIWSKSVPLILTKTKQV
jgi:high-affinity iron transporter